MPLILLTGYPSSGKTHRAMQLLHYLSQKISTSPDPQIASLKIHHITDPSCALFPSVYTTARSEKDARATLSSAIKRHLSSSTIVVADSLNYIKGFRYQLYCEAKALSTPSCVLHIGTPIEKCREWNARSLANPTPESPGYPDEEVFENLIYRYEEPNGMARWDSPLFTIPFSDPEPPCDEIWEALFGNNGNPKIIRPNAATVLKPASAENFLYELDRSTSEIVSAITTWTADHAEGCGGDVVCVQGLEGEKGGVELPASGAPSLSQLQRLRRQFIGLNRQHSSLSKGRIRELFVDYLNDAFQS